MALQETIAQPIHLHSDATSVLYGATGQWTFRIGMVRDESLHCVIEKIANDGPCFGLCDEALRDGTSKKNCIVCMYC